MRRAIVRLATATLLAGLALAGGLSVSETNVASAPPGASVASGCSTGIDFSVERMVNLTSQNFAVIFTTPVEALSSLRATGPEGDLPFGGPNGSGARIVRKRPATATDESTIHYYEVAGLSIGADYMFEGIVDGVGAGRIQGIILPETPGFPPFPKTMKGFVRDSTDSEGICPDLVVFKIFDDDGFGSRGQSELGVVLTSG